MYSENIDFPLADYRPSWADRSWIEIDLSAIRHNVHMLKKRAGNNRLLMVCVKNNGYGHGAVLVGRNAEKAGVDRLAVAHVDEGVELRRAGIKVPIHVLIEPPIEAAEAIAEYNLIPSLSTFRIASGLAKKLDRCIKVHIEVDTGMGRVGLMPEMVVDFTHHLNRLKKFNIEGIFSHFSSAGDPDNPGSDHHTLEQIDKFNKIIKDIEADGHYFPIKHMASSDAVVNYPDSYFDLIRPGAWLYGFKNVSIGIDLKPVLSWKTTILKVLSVKKGRVVGYEMSFKPEKDTKVAILPIGYGVGYPRALSNCAEVLIRGEKAPIAGLVGMEQTMVDVGDIPNVKTGDEAVLIGNQGSLSITAAELADKIGLYGVMITCNINDRVKRIFLKEC